MQHLSAFFPEYDGLVYRKRGRAVAGWGRKRTSQLPRIFARFWGVPYLALEDGFIRSYGLGKKDAAPFSLVVDHVGIYYDARTPSRLEQLIPKALDDSEQQRARRLMALLVQHRITKYNTGLTDYDLPKGEYVLVVDQCAGDASIACGLASAQSFSAMLAAARAENPNATILIKTHPDVLSGLRAGHLKPIDERMRLLDADINAYALFSHVSRVYTVTSLTGMEALIAGVPVRCFGMPFYAGWGLTQDEMYCERRGDVTLEQLVHAAYIDYPRYIDPVMGEPAQVEDAIAQIVFIRRYYERHASDYHCVGFTRWKRWFVRPYLQSVHNRVIFHDKLETALDAIKSGGSLAVWSAKRVEEKLPGDVPVVRIEDGFIRSVGLGSDLLPAWSLSIDPVGIHYDCRKPSLLEQLLQTHEFSEEELARARALRQRIADEGLGKYNSEARKPSPFPVPSDRQIVLVVGQVEHDASIRFGSPEITSNAALIRAVRELRPDAFIIYKPHPDIVAGNRRGKLVEPDADLVLSDIALPSLLALADEVHCMTSLAGFEALLQGIRVVTHGLPFYAGWGLTEDRLATARRTRLLSLDQLVAAALILYPSYIDMECFYPATPEAVVEKLVRLRARKIKRSLMRRGVSSLTSFLRPIR